MKHTNFTIGMIFYTCTGQRWCCTDVGQRTILAIELKPDLDENWFKGPPYAVTEIPFDEYDIRGAYRDEEEAIHDSIEEADNSNHPGFPHEVVLVMMKASYSADTRAYPREGLLRIERVDGAGNILHPYAVEREEDGWHVLIFRPLLGDFQRMAEGDFILLKPVNHDEWQIQDKAEGHTKA